MIRSERLGIVYNDQMDDFSIPGSKNFFGFEPSRVNYIEPGKRPMSSMSPLIIYNKKTRDVKASIGAAGGSKICSAIAQVLLHALSFNKTIKEAIDFPRFHNQFTPIFTTYEKGFPSVSQINQSAANPAKKFSFSRFFFAGFAAL
jgi:gamma-glutamyltranspeptidase